MHFHLYIFHHTDCPHPNVTRIKEHSRTAIIIVLKLSRNDAHQQVQFTNTHITRNKRDHPSKMRAAGTSFNRAIKKGNKLQQRDIISLTLNVSAARIRAGIVNHWRTRLAKKAGFSRGQQRGPAFLSRAVPRIRSNEASASK